MRFDFYDQFAEQAAAKFEPGKCKVLFQLCAGDSAIGKGKWRVVDHIEDLDFTI